MRNIQLEDIAYDMKGISDLLKLVSQDEFVNTSAINFLANELERRSNMIADTALKGGFKDEP